jgi:type II secretory pathway component PulF
MPTFEYQAENAAGKPVRGTVFGTSLEIATRDLAAQGLTVSQIGLAKTVGDPLSGMASPNPSARIPISQLQGARPPEQPSVEERMVERALAEPELPTGPDILGERSYVARELVGPLVGQVPLSDLSFFFRQAGTMLHAGVPIVQSFSTLSKQSKSPKLATIIKELTTHIEAGRQISFGMQRYPEVFQPIIMSLVRAGEKGGFLDEGLTQAADYLDREIALRNLYKRVTFYPKLQIGASIVIILGANAVIGSINAKAGKLDSPLTQVSTWLWLGPLIIAIFLFFRVGLANARIRYDWDLVLAKIPAIGKIYHELAMARFGRAFGALYRGGVPMTEAMKMAADACGNEYLRAKMQPAVKGLESGETFTETLRATDAFNPIVLDMVASGETTGNLDHMLGRMAEFYEGESTTKTTQLGYLSGVIIGLLVAVYIGYIVINFYTGYFGGMGAAAG